MGLMFPYLMLFAFTSMSKGERLECMTALGLDGYLCNNGECMIKEWYCDGMIDCTDRSDEICNSTYVAPTSLQEEYAACQAKLRQCDFQNPYSIIPKPENGEITPSHVDAFCEYVGQFSSCVEGMNDLCYQVEEISLVYIDIHNIVCLDPFVKNYTRRAMTNMPIWRHMNYALHSLNGILGFSEYKTIPNPKREEVCYILGFLLLSMRDTLLYWVKVSKDLGKPLDGRLLMNVPMIRFINLLHPLKGKYGDINDPECRKDLLFRV